MFRPVRLRIAPPRMVSRSLRRREPGQWNRGRRSVLLAVAAAAAAVSGCCSSAYGPSPYGGGVPGYYNQPYGASPYGAQPYGQPQFAPQPIPGTIQQQGGTYLGAPSNGGVPALPAPDSGFGFPDSGDFDNLGEPTYDGGFGETPTGGSSGPDSGGPFYDGDNAGYGPPPANGGGTPVPPLDDYDTLDIDSPNPDGVQDFEPAPPGDSPFEGFQDPAPGDFGSNDPFRENSPGSPSPSLAAAASAATPLPQTPAQPLLGTNAGGANGRIELRSAAASAQPAGPSRTVTGVVEHDPATKTWTLTYTMSPDRGDRFGGVLTLLDNGHLAGLEGEKNLIVSVDGRIDPAAGPDALGKPRFRVEAASERGYYEGQ
ncbi:hypothetical protein [Alienimonas chondri]|uniref:Uncharacterized protein n=1 Tax=Alienimonas chondri TaxID=2681879 RepID=A0ABX1VH09_9PLAN|nr:hypothetical protein [Alienimonas chondri]NNJ27370.1 hypothetical protein [Alienimonas chondri]